MTIFCETATYGKTLTASLISMPTITCASVQATIDKTYLKWLDIGKLLNAFPQLVQLVGEAVVFQGPVTIISPLNLTQRLVLPCSLAGICGGLTLLLGYIVLLKKPNQANSLYWKKLIIVASTSLASGAIAFFLASRVVPTRGGVFFPGQPPFYA